MKNVVELARRLMERGIDVVDVLLTALSREDPEGAIRERINIAEAYMAECREYLDKGDPVQASEKAYKAAEEVIKALAEKFKTVEYQEALREGRWYTYLLSRASKTLASQLGDWVLDGWNSAYDLHVWGFHEGKLTVDYVKVGVRKVETMINEARGIIIKQ
jgi:hypothetical protein